MDARSGFQRNYFIFVNEDTGYEAGQKPSGHIKMEIRDGRGRLNAAVQNLRPGNGRFDYALYLFSTGTTPGTSLCAGNLEARLGKAELEWTFAPDNVGRSGVPIEDFDVFAIIAESTAGHENNPACPLAAYRNRRVAWKSDFRMSRMVKKQVQPAVMPLPELMPKPATKPEIKPLPELIAKPEIMPLPESEIQPAQPQSVSEIEPQTAPLTTPVEQPQTSEPMQADVQTQLYQATPLPEGDQAQTYQYSPMQQTGQFYGAGQEQQYDQGTVPQDEQTQAYTPYQFYQEQPVNTYDPNQIYQQSYQPYSPLQGYDQPVQSYETDQQPGIGQVQEAVQPMEPVQYPGEVMQQPAGTMPSQPEAEAAQMQQPEVPAQEQPANPEPEEPQMPGTDEMQQMPPATETTQGQAVRQDVYESPVGPGNLYTGCLYLNGNICGAILNSMPETASPCDACKVHRGEPSGQVQPAGDLSRLKAIMDLNFEVSDPFHSKRSDYEWWKITNPVNLNNILYQNNIRSPLMFNPAVMLAHYKYHHLIVGIFTRKDGQKYVVCGVPGMHMVDRKPFGDLSKWVQADGSRSRYGAYGYWLVYLNPDDGKILNLNQE